MSLQGKSESDGNLGRLLCGDNWGLVYALNSAVVPSTGRNNPGWDDSRGPQQQNAAKRWPPCSLIKVHEGMEGS